MENKELEIGTHLFSVSTGRVSPFMKKSKEAVDYIVKLDGFVAIHPTPDGEYTMWLFDSVGAAIRGKNLMEHKGIECGNNICEFELTAPNTVDFRGVAAGKDKGKGYK